MNELKNDSSLLVCSQCDITIKKEINELKKVQSNAIDLIKSIKNNNWFSIMLNTTPLGGLLYYLKPKTIQLSINMVCGTIVVSYAMIQIYIDDPNLKLLPKEENI